MLALAAAPTLAFGQAGCLPPQTPFAYEPPKDDPELRQMIDEDYQTYIRDTEAYLNCLNAEAMRVRVEFDAVLKRYVQYFGSEAGVRYEQTN
ncbi:MAG: hypothetical protein Q4P24_07410 [Rhodobacterales bacterium]|nr:hypothetical protein [Rhodobacterales bacterium]